MLLNHFIMAREKEYDIISSEISYNPIINTTGTDTHTHTQSANLRKYLIILTM